MGELVQMLGLENKGLSKTELGDVKQLLTNNLSVFSPARGIGEGLI